jgi:hypothetical protein
LIVSDTYVEPFAVRALGVVREDEKLVERAVRIFETLGLAWHASRTQALMRTPASSAS